MKPAQSSSSWVAALLAVAALLVLYACATPRSATSTNSSGSESNDPVCRDLRAQIDRNQKRIRAAPTLSNTPIIQEATVAKADDRIETLQARYRDLDCDQAAPSAPAPAAAAAP